MTSAIVESKLGLGKMRRDGVLGKLLIEKLGGALGRVSPTKDVEFMIGFGTPEKTPSTQQIEPVVVEYYTKLGYTVKVSDTTPQDMFEALISSDDLEEGWFLVVISTNYPLTMGDNHSHARVTTSMI